MPTLVRHCPICGARTTSPLYAYGPAKFKIIETRSIVMHGCSACGAVFQNPLPNQDELDAYYRTQWESQCSTTPEHHQRYHKMADLLSQTIEPQPAGDKRVLDVGCGFAAFLDALQDRGWQTFGIEPGVEARAVAARRHTMFDSPPASGQYELIILSHVIEHLRDPLGELRRLRELLAPEGSLYAAVPDLGRLARHRNVQNVFNGAHLFAFTALSLQQLLRTAGLQPYRHLEDPSWDEADATPADRTLRLRMLARRDSTACGVAGDGRDRSPLGAAQEALSGYFRGGPISSRVRYALPVWMQAAWYRLRS